MDDRVETLGAFIQESDKKMGLESNLTCYRFACTTTWLLPGVKLQVHFAFWTSIFRVPLAKCI